MTGIKDSFHESDNRECRGILNGVIRVVVQDAEEELFYTERNVLVNWTRNLIEFEKRSG